MRRSGYFRCAALTIAGTRRNQRPELWRLYNTRLRPSAKPCASFRCRIGPNTTFGNTSRRRKSRWCRSISRRCGRSSIAAAPGSWSMTTACRFSPARARNSGFVRFRTLGCYPLTGAIEFGGHDTGRDPGGTARHQAFRASGSLDRQRRGRGDGAQKARGLFLMAASLAKRAHPRSDRDLLRFLTCGSVDDGKSTLIGRLLHDCALIFDDQLEALERESKRFGTTGRQPRFFAAPRRARGRAAAAHNDRCRVPLFRDPGALLYRRRYAGSRAIHPQHGDRRLDLRSCRDPGRCPQRARHPRPGGTPLFARCSAFGMWCWR